MNKKGLKNLTYISIFKRQKLKIVNLFELILLLTPKIRKIKKWTS